MDLTQKPVANRDFMEEVFSDEVLLYTTTTTKGIYLNNSAYVVWKLCEEELTIEEMISLLEEKYPDQKGQMKTDVIAAIEMLLEGEAITLTEK